MSKPNIKGGFFIAPRFKNKGRGGIKIGTPKPTITIEKQRRSMIITQRKKDMKLKELNDKRPKPISVNSKLHGSAFYEAWDRAHGLDGDKETLNSK